VPELSNHRFSGVAICMEMIPSHSGAKENRLA
jgi:hypothetical protein